ncbi:C4b-binding protein alpha chain-like isoform X2 [Scyliorhinus canicula]|uniref:C4b-binding protein alpha chain-like isoform X2 n=1 Tax=Scyliorhinus canicula TaxID=7830 RepID=UPI0018F7B359|nr:C4b-binding protein alpha chain-like isoform X2 [Scyliorhinus canicula]
MLKDWGMSGRLILALTAAWVARVTGDCGKLPPLENGSPTDDFISNTTFPVGTRATYKCFPGYIFKEGGSKVVFCRENSTWSPLRAVCEPKNCGNPGEILNGYYDAPNTTLGSKAAFYCYEGYIIVGKTYRTCTANGWDGQVPTCQIVMCPDPPSISNGSVSLPPNGGDWIYGSVATYSCIAGLSLIGENFITCTQTKEWSGNPPRCQVVQCARPKNPDNGRIISGLQPQYSYMDAITYKCDEHFEMVGESTIKCTENNTFVPPPPTCEPGNCKQPPVLKNGFRTDNVSQTTFPVGTNITYECDPGYVFQKGSSKYITCLKDTTWSPLQAVCEPEFTTEVSSFTTKGTTEVSSFTTKGTTEASSSVTKAITCPDPPLIQDATSSPKEEIWEFGMKVTYSCNGNFTLIGDESITCTLAGEWSDPPTCRGGSSRNVGQQFELLLLLGLCFTLFMMS